MRFRFCRDAAVLALIATASCTDAVVPTAPGLPAATNQLKVATGVSLRANTTVGDDAAVVSPALDVLNSRMAAAGAGIRVAKAELILDARKWDRTKAVVILAKDFTRGIGAEWVRGDLRRGGRRGVTYAFGSNLSTPPYVFNEDRTDFRPLTQVEQQKQVEKGMDAWRDLKCSRDPITGVGFPAGTDPDFVNDIVRFGVPSANYAQPADVVHSGWQPLQFFQAIAGPDAAVILGVTFTFVFVDAAGIPTDVDDNGEADIALSEIYYNDIYVWSTNGRPDGTVDLFSIIAHESGHALGLAHWGLIYVKEKDAMDGISPDEIRFRPKAMMNALYVGGRSRIERSDNINFCLIWENSSHRKGKERSDRDDG